MKKTKLMALVLVGAISLTGAGYAAWSNTITDTTSINTGNWSVVLEKDSDWSYYAADQVDKFTLGKNEEGKTITKTSERLNGDSGDHFNKNNAYESLDASGAVKSNWESKDPQRNFVYTLAPSEISGDKTACSFDFRNLHPGTQVMTRFEMRNNGSIPAKIAAVKLTILSSDGKTKLYENGNYTTASNAAAYNAVKEVLTDMKVTPFFELHRGNKDDATHNRTLIKDEVSFANLQTELNKLVGTVMAPTDYVHTVSDELESGIDGSKPVFTFRIPAEALKKSDGTNLGQNASFKVQVDFDFVQYNDISNNVTNTDITDVPAKTK